MAKPKRKMRLGVVGAGPKALALAAKNRVLARAGFATPEIVIFEKNEVAFNWKPASGLTSGHLPLGTSPDKDVGFPYYSFCWGDAINHKVNAWMQEFSWQAFLISVHQFSDWVDRGRPSPTHSAWCEYLEWVYERVKSDLQFVNAEVKSVDIQNDRWSVFCQNNQGLREEYVLDGLVFTGPGIPRLPGPLPNHDRVLSTETFWWNVRKYTALPEGRFALVGAGETAANIAVTLGCANPDLHVDILSPHAMTYSRGESYVENHLFTDPFQGNWLQLTKEDRRNFISRTDRGVFSLATKRELDLLKNIEVVPGAFRGACVDSLDQLLVDIEYNQDRECRIYDFVILSMGFDPLEFVRRLLTPEAHGKILSQTGASDLSHAQVEDRVDSFMALEGLTPYLHLPMLSGINQGPGFANLSCLGRLSDHILSRYVSMKSLSDDSPVFLGMDDSIFP